ncbi:MAG TPA: hypothetical protein VEZ47_08185 [Gemmatirosa sp.]|nr:hypothetical protein [Gemmatirosa sp.]
MAPASDHDVASAAHGSSFPGPRPGAELPSEQLWRAALHAALGAAHAAAELRRELSARAMPPAA